MARLLKMYECEHCNRVLRKTKKGIDNHEAKCFLNLATRSCATCENYSSGGIASSTDERRVKRKCYEGVCIRERLQTNCSHWEERDDLWSDDYYNI